MKKNRGVSFRSVLFEEITFNMNQPDISALGNRLITVPSDANMLPPEFSETPQPVIGFLGLDCNRNLTHKSIWDAFNTNRKSDRYLMMTFLALKQFS